MVLYDLDSGGVIEPGDDPRYPVALGGVSGDEPSSAWKLRARSGGATPEPPGDDPLDRALTPDSPRLLPGAPFPSRPHRRICARPEPACERPVDRLVPTRDGAPGARRSSARTGRRGRGLARRRRRVDLSRDRLSGAPTPDAVISAAAERWQHRPDADVEHFLDDVLGCLAALRNLGAGKTVEALAVVGLRGLELEPDLEYELPVGLLRTPTITRRATPPSSRVRLRSTQCWWCRRR